MPLGIHEILFRLSGESEDAREELEKVAAELAAFSKIHAEAEAEVETQEAHDRLRRLRFQLERMEAGETNPRIRLDIAGVLAQLAAVEAELERLDREDVTIDVELRRGIMDRIQGLTRNTNLLTRASRAAGEEQAGLASRIAQSTVNIGPFTTQLRVLFPLMLGFSGVIVALAGAIGALVASLAMAIAAVGALATAFVGALIPAAGLAFAVIQRFQQQSEKAGTAAHALAQGWKEFQKILKTLLPAADPVLRALSEILRAAGGMVRVLRPAFIQFGKAIGQAMGIFADALRDPAIRAGIADLIRLSADVFPPLIRAAVALGRIFLNIARAAMPLLVTGLEAMAGALEGIAGGTENISKLRAGIAGLVEHLEAWLDLLWQISRVFVNFFRAAAPAGLSLTKSLAGGAKALADWLGSSEGMERVGKFMKEAVPLAKEVLETFARLVVIFIQIGEVTMPFLTPLFETLNAVLTIVSALVERVAQLPAPVRQLIGLILMILLPWTKVWLIVRAVVVAIQLLAAVGGNLGGIFGGLGRIFAALGRAMLAVVRVGARLIASWIRLQVQAGKFLARLVARFAAAFGRIVARAAAFAAQLVAKLAQGFARVIAKAANFVGRFVARLASGFARAVSQAVRFVSQFVSRIAQGLARAISQAARFAGRFVATIARGIARAVAAAGRFVGDFFRAGVDLIKGFIDGVTSMIDDAVDAVGDLVGKAKDQITSGFGILSPSKVMAGYGRDMVRGLTRGIASLSGEPAAAMEELAEGLRMRVGLGAALPLGPGGLPGQGGTVNQNVTVQSPSIGGRSDPHVIAMQLAMLLRQQGVRVG